jgi:hypothetical protein
MAQQDAADTPFAVPPDAPEGSYEYRAVQSGPPVSSTECETAASVIEVKIFWGRTLLEVRHLSPPRSCSLGPGSSVRVAKGALVYEITATKAGRKAAAGVGTDALRSSSLLCIAASLLVHLGLLTAIAVLVPPLSAAAADDITDEQRLVIQQYIESAAERETEQRPVEQLVLQEDPTVEGGTGSRAKGSEGAMGDPTREHTGKHYAVQGAANDPDAHLARMAALRDAATFGMIGLMNAGAGGDPNAPTAPWGRDESVGTDPLSARGNLWGDGPGASFGAGGLGLSGIGEGGGGLGEGIGLGALGTIGHGAGTGTGQGFGPGAGGGSGSGCGCGWGRRGRSHRVRAPRVHAEDTVSTGRLPAEVIQRIVRQNFGRFRLCYENGLRTSPSLQGRVVVRFVIGRDGQVSNVGGGGDLPDGAVVSCVTRAFYGLSFPQPDGGIVTVSYPIAFSPGDGR